MIRTMGNSEKSKNLRQVKNFVPGDRSSKLGVKSKSSGSDAAHPKNHLAWYVALNSKPSELNISSIPRIRWKCPYKFDLDTDWHVAAGEGSHEADAQKCREETVLEAFYPRLSAIPPSPLTSPDVEGEHSDNSQIPIIPIIPIEAVIEAVIEAEMPLDASTEVNICINSQPSAPPKVPSVSGTGNLPLSQCNPSDPQDHPVDDKPLPDILRGLEKGEVEVAVAAAATVAAVLQSEEQIDTELLIKALSSPEIRKTLTEKLIDEDGSRVVVAAADTVAAAATVAAVMQSKEQINTKLLIKLLTDPELIYKLIDENGSRAKAKNGTPAAAPAPEANTSFPLPSSAPALAVKKLANKCSEPLSRAIPSYSRPQAVNKSLPLPCSKKVETAINISASKQVVTREGSASIFTSKPVKNLSPLPRSDSDMLPVNKLTIEPRGPAHSSIHQIAEVKQVRPLMLSYLRPDEETIERLINKYVTPGGVAGVRPIHPLNPSTSIPKMEVIKKMINEYGPHNATDIKPVAPPLIACTPRPLNMEEMKKKVNEHGVPGHVLDNPFLGRHPLLVMPPRPNSLFLPNALESNFTSTGSFHFPSYSSSTIPPPSVDLQYCKSLIEQHGKNHGIEEHELPNFGQPGFEMNPKHQKPCVFFNSPRGCRNGSKCPYQHDASKQSRAVGEVEVPFAKRMKLNGWTGQV